jgi:uncharacterized membrane protein YqhA
MSTLPRLIVATRYVMLVVVICLAAMVAVAVFHGTALTVKLVGQVIVRGGDVGATKAVLFDIIELVDVFLVAATLYVIMIGLYELFIDPTLPSPAWLETKTLDDLKAKVLVMVIVVMGVFFLGQVVSWDGTRDVLALGAAIALAIGALTLFLALSRTKSADASTSPSGAADPKHVA